MSEAGLDKPRLLYVDDDAALARLVQKDLGRRGYDVVWAEGGDAGLERLRQERFDVVALDHFMPGREGLDVLAEIMGLPAAPPVVYVTGAQDGRLAVTALKAGAADYVIKDVGEDFLALLRAAVDDAVERGLLRRQKEEAEAEIRAARDRAEALLREVNHRIGNSLQLVSSFIGMQTRALKEESARQALRETQARIEAVAHIHRRLYTSDDVTSVELKDYFAGLVEELSDSIAREEGAPTIVLHADSLRAPTDRAVSLGVIVAELVTNAVKYAYPEGQGGEIRVRLIAEGERGGVLMVEDDGQGLGDGTPKGTGLGQRIIGAMASNLRSAVTYENGRQGVRAKLAFEL